MNRFVFALMFVFVGVEAKAQQKSSPRFNWSRVGIADTYNHEYVRAATAAIRETMEENFHASSAENLDALMETMTSNCPDRENFMRECQKMFEDTDVYIRLVDCRWITSWRDSKGLWAAVEIKQWTVPKDDKVDYTEYRHRSGLLPKWELCEYQLFARVESGRWKAHVINGNVFEAPWPADGPSRQVVVERSAARAEAEENNLPRRPAPKKTATVAVQKENCPDGKCPNQWPATQPQSRPRMTTLKK